MVYEKKMLILTGEGSGVVMIEKSARGVKFALRTLGVACSDNMRAGIITRKAVHVRDLPAESDPSAVFFIDDADIEGLHFAVFDARLLLYGTTSKTRMWEANIMGLLNKYGAPVVLPEKVLPVLPPVTARPAVLPMPDGTGIPQSGLAVYGDDALAESDIYTTVDMTARMRIVDSFLDTPRVLNVGASVPHAQAQVPAPEEKEEKTDLPQADIVREVRGAVLAEAAATSAPPSALDGLSPHIIPPPDIPAYALFPPDRDTANASVDTAQTASRPTTPSTAQTADADTLPDRTEIVQTADITEIISEASQIEAEKNVVSAMSADEKPTAVSEYAADGTDRGPAVADGEAAHAHGDGDENGTAAGSIVNVDTEMCEALPWVLTAKWLKARSGRAPIVSHDRVRTVKPKTDIAALREVAFFERCRSDIEKLFSSAPRDEELAALLPDIDWVKVEVGGNTVGVGKSDNAFLCYAVKGVYEKTSPFGEEAQWLPKLKNAPTGRGYWLIFQDLISGEIIGS